MQTWTELALTAVDLEGTGAQDGDDEAILEIAAVPLTAGRPDVPAAYTTTLNPGRAVPRRPWISPGLTTAALADSPKLQEAEPELAARLDGKIWIGHNIRVDARLLARRCPAIKPVGLIDTLKLAKHIEAGQSGYGLQAVLERRGLTAAVRELAPGGQPHRALWDTVAAALLLADLAAALPDQKASVLQTLAGVFLDPQPSPPEETQMSIFNL